MGVNIYATNSDYKFSLSYSGFNRIRRVIADRLDSDFGDLYYEWTKVPNTFSIKFSEESHTSISGVRNRYFTNNYIDFL